MTGITIELLALSYPPAGTGTSILDWQPFPSGDNLNEISNTYNKRCLKVYQERDFPKLIIQSYREVLRPNMHDLSDARDELSVDQFETIRIILIDLEKIAGQDKTLQWLRGQINAYAKAKKWQYYYIAQISQTHGASSISDKFKDIPCSLSEPEVLTQQEELELFLLKKICQPYHDSLREVLNIGLPHPEGLQLLGMPRLVPASGPLSDKTSAQYQASVERILNDVRDTANIHNLDSGEIAMLTRHAAAQEFALSRIAAEVSLETPTRVVLDSLRQPVIKMAVKPVIAEPKWHEVNMMKVFLNRSIRSLAPWQKKQVLDLGVKGKNYTTVHVDQPEMRYKVHQLRDVLDTANFSAFMPSTAKDVGDF